MPRQARLDAPGVLQHLMARGIERRKIFRDDKDRVSFLVRLSLILEETQTQCYAWVLSAASLSRCFERGKRIVDTDPNKYQKIIN